METTDDIIKERLHVSLVCYADDSCTHDEICQQDGAEGAVVAGYISWKENWDHFECDWQQVLDRYHIEQLHMEEFSNENKGAKNPDWPYRGWSRKKRDEFIHELIPIARDNTLFGLVGSVDVRSYNSMLPDWMKAEYEHPYHLCFQLFFDQVIEIPHNHMEAPLPPNEQVAFFFDQQFQFKSLAEKRYAEIKALRDKDDRMGVFSYVNRKRYKPIQAADLLAYRQRKVFTRKLNADYLVKNESWDSALIARRNLIARYYDKEHLEIHLNRVLAERNRLSCPWHWL
jgi:hypothetical protein